MSNILTYFNPVVKTENENALKMLSKTDKCKRKLSYCEFFGAVACCFLRMIIENREEK